MPIASNRMHHVDALFDADTIEEDFSNRLLLRAVAKNIILAYEAMGGEAPK